MLIYILRIVLMILHNIIRRVEYTKNEYNVYVRYTINLYTV